MKQACEYDAIELDMQAKTFELKVGAVVWATGWSPYDAKKLDTLGFGTYPNVITNVMMERLAAEQRPHKGQDRSSFGRQVRRRRSVSFNAQVRAMRTISRSAPRSAAWLP